MLTFAKRTNFIFYYAIVFYMLLVMGVIVLKLSHILPDRFPKARPEEQRVNAPLSYQQLLDQNRIKPPGLIVLVDLHYDKNAQPAISIKNLHGMNGYVPKHPDELPQVTASPTYTLQVKSASSDLVYTLHFQVPNTQMSDALGDDKNFHGNGEKILSQVDFAEVIPWTANSSRLEVADARNSTVTQSSLTDVKFDNNAPNFLTLQTDTNQPATPDTQQTLNITFIGDMFQQDLGLFHSNVSQFSNHMTSLYEPYKSRASQLTFRYVDNTDPLYCRNDGGYITCGCNNYPSQPCDPAYVIQRVGATPWDKIMVIVNDPTNYGGGSGLGSPVSTAYNGSWGSQIFVHEFEHAFASLEDEYDYGITEPYTNQVDANCYAGLPPAAPWQNIVAQRDYYIVCGRSNWYRASNDSLMHGIATTYLNAVSQNMINSTLNNYVGPYTNSSSPTATLSSPSSGIYVSGLTTFPATAADDAGVGWVDLWENNTVQNTAYLSPYSLVWNSGTVAGLHTLVAKAHDSAGNMGTSAPVSVVVCPGDANHNGTVSIVDFNILKSTYGKQLGDYGYDGRADFNGDNIVGISDLNIYKIAQGTDCIRFMPTGTP